MRKLKTLLSTLLLPLAAASTQADTLLVEAEHFENHGGWKCDTQFLHSMGSPYLIAHGMGKAVADATHTIEIKKAGEYRLMVRTFDWCARWDVKGPGKFKVEVDGKQVPVTFGTEGRDWQWQQGGSIKLEAGKHTLKLKDLSGFDGRIDCLILTDDPNFTPDNSSKMMAPWREKLLPQKRETKKYDLVVIGGGFAGMGTALSAGRQGLRVAFVQDREVLGGNGSSEIRVRPEGNTPASDYPIGQIIHELASKEHNAGPAKGFQDAKKMKIFLAEKNVDLYMGHFAHAVDATDGKINAVSAMEVKKAVIRRFEAPLYADCTGHGTIGLLAGAELRWQLRDHMGMSCLYNWSTKKETKSFPKTPWALQLTEKMFPYPGGGKGQWFWESGFNKNPLYDLEATRDWNLRAVYGAWNAIKNKGAYKRYNKKGTDLTKASLNWVAYIGGTRETLQLTGDVLLTKQDILSKKQFDDGCVLTTWGLDLHYAHPLYSRHFPDNPFISRAHFGGRSDESKIMDHPTTHVHNKKHGSGVDRKKGYAVPYRCFYSRNIGNLFMPGRNMSVDHDALGTVRVMKTLGMAGVVVGRAARICVEKDCTPREVYTKHLALLKERLKQPGQARLPLIEKK